MTFLNSHIPSESVHEITDVAIITDTQISTAKTNPVRTAERVMWGCNLWECFQFYPALLEGNPFSVSKVVWWDKFGLALCWGGNDIQSLIWAETTLLSAWLYWYQLNRLCWFKASCSRCSALSNLCLWVLARPLRPFVDCLYVFNCP